MALKKPKKLKYPRKPKKSASNEVKQKWLDKCKEIDKTNKERQSNYSKAKTKQKELDSKIYR